MYQSKERVEGKSAGGEEKDWEELLKRLKDEIPDSHDPRKDEEMDDPSGPGAVEESLKSGEYEPESENVPRKKPRDGGAGKRGKGEDSEDSMQKRPKRASRKELLELIKRKNEMLQAMGEAAEKIRQDVENKNDKILRMAAEFENYKKRMRREWELHQKRASADLIRELLGILDDFDRALESLGDEEDHFNSGIRLIHSGLFEVLKRAGLKEVEAQGRPFDPQFHEAMGEIETDETEEGCIAHVVQKGYMLHDFLLRPAKVIVAKKHEQP